MNYWMEQALAEAERARYRAPPNPWVGCVIVKDGRIVGRGATQPPGGPHAEVEALAQAGAQASGATAFTTLEPCCHFGRTGPCADALVRAGITQVVTALLDPDTRVAGQGVARLRAAGVEVVVGPMADQARRQLLPYLHQRSTGRPWAVMKAAISIDGRTAAADSSSQWISGGEARADAHLLRDQSQAILVGAGTAIADQPSLTIRTHAMQSLHPPLRVLWDPSGRVAPNGPLFDTSLAPTLVVRKTAPTWTIPGIEVLLIEDLAELYRELASRGVLQLLVEGGSTLQQLLWDAQLIDQLTVYVGSCILGSSGLPLFPGTVTTTIQQAPRLTLDRSTQLEDTIRMDYLCSLESLAHRERSVNAQKEALASHSK